MLDVMTSRRDLRAQHENRKSTKRAAVPKRRAHGYPSHMPTTWNGSLSFGLVSIPVGLAPATKPAARQSDVSFRLLHREDLVPIKQKRWCPEHDRELAPDEI